MHAPPAPPEYSISGSTSCLIPSMLFMALPILIFLAIFLFAVPTTLGRAIILIVMIIPWILILLTTVVFLAKRDEARLRQALSGENWLTWQEGASSDATVASSISFGPLGICIRTDPPLLIDFGDGLLGASVERQDSRTSVLQFRYRAKRRSWVAYSIETPLGVLISLANIGVLPRENVTNIAIPNGHRTEAEALAKRYRTTFIGQPTGSLVDRWLGLSVYFGASMLYFIVGFIISVPPPR